MYNSFLCPFCIIINNIIPIHPLSNLPIPAHSCSGCWNLFQHALGRSKENTLDKPSIHCKAYYIIAIVIYLFIYFPILFDFHFCSRARGTKASARPGSLKNITDGITATIGFNRRARGSSQKRYKLTASNEKASSGALSKYLGCRAVLFVLQLKTWFFLACQPFLIRALQLWVWKRKQRKQKVALTIETERGRDWMKKKYIFIFKFVFCGKNIIRIYF